MANEIYINFFIERFSIYRKNYERITTKNRNYVCARFDFQGGWDGLNKTAIFSKDGLASVRSPIENGICAIPDSFMDSPGIIKVSAYAGDLRTVNEAEIDVIESGYKDGAPPIPPEPDNAYVQTTGGSVPFIRSNNGVFQYYAGGAWNEITGSGGSNPPGGQAGGASDAAWLPAVSSDGIISWTRSNSTAAPAPQNIKGPAGTAGAAGPQGAKGSDGKDGYTPVKGTDYFTAADIAQLVDGVITALPVNASLAARLNGGA